MIAYDLMEKLWRLNRIFCSSDYDASLAYLQSILPLNIHEYRTPSPYKGWVVPPRWELVRGLIRKEGRLIFEVDHPLKIIGLSRSFSGTVSRQELKRHLHYDHREADRIPYHFRQHYRPWERDWGFCVSQHFYDSLEEGDYQVEIATMESEGVLKVAECVKQGESPESFAFVAHLDHPGMANDDLAGVAVGVELFHRLMNRKTKFTYRLLLVQEIIGSVFYLDNRAEKNIVESCFLEMLGTTTPLVLQQSHSGKSGLERGIAELSSISSGPFRSIICNDEVVWESHQIPMCSLSRYPYPEYHSDKDNLSIISKGSLSSTVELLSNLVDLMEKKTLIRREFEGFYSLAHPDYNLYIDPGQPAFNKIAYASSAKLRALMDQMPLLPKYSFVDRLASDLDLSEDLVLDYLRLWEKKGLISLL
jgi:aminopeptidase-like protein